MVRMRAWRVRECGEIESVEGERSFLRPHYSLPEKSNTEFGAKGKIFKLESQMS